MLHFVTHLPLSYINRVHVVLRSRPVRPCPIASDEWVRVCRFNYPRFSCMVRGCRGIICRRIVQFQGETEIKKARLDLDDDIGDDGDAIEFPMFPPLFSASQMEERRSKEKQVREGKLQLGPEKFMPGAKTACACACTHASWCSGRNRYFPSALESSFCRDVDYVLHMS